MQDDDILMTTSLLKLSNCLQEGKTFDITNGSTNFGNNHIQVWINSFRLFNSFDDLISDMWNDLYSPTQIVPATLSLQNLIIDTASRAVISLGHVGINKSFVMT